MLIHPQTLHFKQFFSFIFLIFFDNQDKAQTLLLPKKKKKSLLFLSFQLTCFSYPRTKYSKLYSNTNFLNLLISLTFFHLRFRSVPTLENPAFAIPASHFSFSRLDPLFYSSVKVIISKYSIHSCWLLFIFFCVNSCSISTFLISL